MMKKSLFPILCILLLILPLAACSSPAPAPTPEPAPTEEPAATPEPVPETEPPSETPEPAPPAREDEAQYAPYRELIGKVAAGIRDGWTGAAPAELGISDVFTRPGAEELGWLMRDLNNDGTDELLFGRSRADDELTPTFDIFCLLGGALSHPATGWEFNCWYLLPDGMLINEWSNDGNDRCRSAYGFFNGSLIPGYNPAGRDEYIRLDFQPFSAE